MVTVSFGLMAIAIIVWVGHQLGLAHRLLDYWSEASRDTKTGAVSAKRAVFIHSSAGAFFLVAGAVAKNSWTFSPESLDAFKTFLYCTAGAYTLGKGLELAGMKLAPKVAPPVDTPPEGAQP
jgi:hypothetical protein